MNILKRNAIGLCLLLFLLCADTESAEYTDGRLGKGLILDGSSQTVRIPHYAGLKPAVEPIARMYIELRYHLLPYNYTLAW